MAFHLHSNKKYFMGTYYENEIKYVHPETKTEYSVCYLVYGNLKEEVKFGGPHVTWLLTAVSRTYHECWNS